MEHLEKPANWYVKIQKKIGVLQDKQEKKYTNMKTVNGTSRLTKWVVRQHIKCVMRQGIKECDKQSL